MSAFGRLGFLGFCIEKRGSARAGLVTLRDVRLCLSLLICACLGACRAAPPPRSVLEYDIEDYRFRRYQQLLDIELPVADNPAVAHAATYVRSGEPIRVHPVLATRYERSEGLVDALRQQLRAMDGYSFEPTTFSRQQVWRMRGSSGDAWVLWVSGVHLIKVGAAEGETELPEALVEAYLKAYPSDVESKRAAGGSDQATTP